MSEINLTGVKQKIGEYKAEIEAKKIPDINEKNYDERMLKHIFQLIKIVESSACDEILKRIGE